MEHLRDPEKHVKELHYIMKRHGLLILQLPNLQYLFEPHSKWPILFALPKRLQSLIFMKLNYSYVNLTVKYALSLLQRTRFILRETKKIYHVGIMKLLPWAPSHVFLLQNDDLQYSDNC